MEQHEWEQKLIEVFRSEEPELLAKAKKEMLADNIKNIRYLIHTPSTGGAFIANYSISLKQFTYLSIPIKEGFHYIDLGIRPTIIAVSQIVSDNPVDESLLSQLPVFKGREQSVLPRIENITVSNDVAYFLSGKPLE